MRFDFERFIEEIPFDLHDITGDILRKTLGDLLVADKKKFDKQVPVLFRKLTTEFGVLNGKYLARWGTDRVLALDRPTWNSPVRDSDRVQALGRPC